ncbi:flagellar biosynthesis repressor FlbT [Methylobacterium soli]|uniref:Flagellar protein FlbT n=1 Tax=Methylobacterium soli TaxID=553447 RepID=A0A6L3SRW8_9HYPH|nr:flagellar biosynthesis repressor FlbT [Methylobacterium soli]KAB1068904.1 flagellar protein FlbT [Methylobacterium soli]GJE46664.1 flagellum biosynthesis repressor protein FlbT [Methylobacterium soli]
MPLRIELKPFERLIINGAAIRNGDRRSSFLMETQCKFLRESEIITESEADTACKRIHLTLTVIYLSDNPIEPEGLFFAQAADLLKAAPSTAPYLLAIQQELEAKRYHHAIKRGKDLVAYEQTLLDRLGPQTEVA